MKENENSRFMDFLGTFYLLNFWAWVQKNNICTKKSLVRIFFHPCNTSRMSLDGTDEHYKSDMSLVVVVGT